MQGNDTKLIWEALMEGGYDPRAEKPSRAAYDKMKQENPGVGRSIGGDIPGADVRNRDMGEIYRRIQKIQKAVEGIDDIKSLEAVEEIIQMIQAGEDEGLYDLKAAQRGEAAQKSRPTSHSSFDEPSFGTDY